MLLHVELVDDTNERHHDFRLRIEAFLLQLHGSTEDCFCLHLCDLWICVSETAAAVSEHRVMLAQTVNALLNLCYGKTHLLCHCLLTCEIVWHELMQWWVEQADVYRAFVHGLEDSVEVLSLIRQQLLERLLASFYCVGENHFTHCLDLLVVEEHVFCTA